MSEINNSLGVLGFLTEEFFDQSGSLPETFVFEEVGYGSDVSRLCFEYDGWKIDICSVEEVSEVKPLQGGKIVLWNFEDYEAESCNSTVVALFSSSGENTDNNIYHIDHKNGSEEAFDEDEVRFVGRTIIQECLTSFIAEQDDKINDAKIKLEEFIAHHKFEHGLTERDLLNDVFLAYLPEEYVQLELQVIEEDDDLIEAILMIETGDIQKYYELYLCDLDRRLYYSEKISDEDVVMGQLVMCDAKKVQEFIGYIDDLLVQQP